MGTTFKAWLIGHMEQTAALLFLVFLGIASFSTEVTTLPPWLFSLWLVIPSVVIGFLPAGFAAKFTWDNFEEVISRSFKWRNSRVEILDKRMSYTTRIFFATYFVTLFGLYCIEFAIAIWA